MTLDLRRVHVGDCRALLAQMPDESVNCVVTSPPYWGLRDYGTGRWEGGDADCAHEGAPKQSQSSTLKGHGHGGDKPLSPSLQEQRSPFRSVCGNCGAARVDKQIGLEETPVEYVAVMVAVFREVRRVLRADGTLWLNLGDSYSNIGKWGGSTSGKHAERLHGGHQTSSRAHGGQIEGLKPKDMVGIPWRVAFALQTDGWYLRSDIVWAKPNPMPESVQDRPTKSHEYLFLMTKSERYRYDADAICEPLTESSLERQRYQLNYTQRAYEAGATPQTGGRREPGTDDRTHRNKRSVWTVATEPYGGAHFATFPRKLVEPCILAGCPAGGVVLDPFGGSGTVGEVAEALGRNWILFDLNPAYADLAAKRTAQRGLFVANEARRATPAEPGTGEPPAPPNTEQGRGTR